MTMAIRHIAFEQLRSAHRPFLASERTVIQAAFQVKVITSESCRKHPKEIDSSLDCNHCCRSSKAAPAHLSHLRITAHTTCAYLPSPRTFKFPSVWLTSGGAFLQDPLGDAAVVCQCQDAGNAQQLNTGTKHRR